MVGLTYNTGTRGVPGYSITITQQDATDSASVPYKTVIPAVGLTDSAGAEIGTSGNPLIVSSSASSTGQVVGNVAHDAVDSGNPVKIGGYASIAAPTAVSDGDRVNLWLGQRGQNFSAITSQTGNAIVDVGTSSDNSAQTNALAVRSVNLVYNGTANYLARGDGNATAVQPALTASFWSYAAASGGITNSTTAVTVKTAAGAGVRNYVEALELSWDSLGAATELAIRDGAGGTVLYRTKLPTGSAGRETVNFGTALKGTANTLLEVVTLTASVTGSVYVNVQGWTGS